MKRQLMLFVSVSWFGFCAVASTVFWVLALPHMLWQPVFEKAFDWMDITMETKP
jgi:hypothetical protein